jgi:surface antigen
MTAKWRRGMALVIGSLLVVSTPIVAASAKTNTEIVKHHSASATRHDATENNTHSDSKYPLSKTGKARYARSGGGLQCVTFARAASGIALKGNAVNWWDAASGVYERGSRPEAGSVLNFRANGHMRLGHVAVVTNVLGSRTLEIDHANWAWATVTKGNVSRGIKVMDVSPSNDWSMVRVELGHSEEFGSEYPTYGFIYDRPDSGRMVANTAATSLEATSRPMLGYDEVAEAPASRANAPAALPVDAPDHSLR